MAGEFRVSLMESKNTRNKLFTLCLVCQNSKVLLGMKKRGFGVEKWNGFGGKVLPIETIEEAAIREVREEAGIVVNNLVKIGILEFEFKNNPEILEVHIFQTDNFSGEPIESEEMRPQWFDINEMPFSKMWQDDTFWFPLFLSEKKFVGKFLYDNSDNIINHKLTVVERI